MQQILITDNAVSECDYDNDKNARDEALSKIPMTTGENARERSGRPPRERSEGVFVLQNRKVPPFPHPKIRTHTVR